MAKLKTKLTVMDTMVKEVSAGTWQWETGRFVWSWESMYHAGLNLSVAEKDIEDSPGTFQQVLFCRRLDDAVMFSHGFEAGIDYAKTRYGIKARDGDNLTTSM